METIGRTTLQRPTRIALLINGRATRAEGDLGAALEELGRAFEVRVTRVDEPSALRERISAAAAEADWLVVGSGDGTLGRSAGALLSAGRPFGILPLGNANDLARSLGIPLDPIEACRALANARPRRIDVGRVNEHYFFNTATLGVGTDVSKEMNVSAKRRWGRLSHLPRLWRSLRARRSFGVRLVCDGREHRFPSVHLTIANGRTHGGGLVVAEDAFIDDGWLDVSNVRPESLAKLIALVPALVFGRKTKSPHLDQLRCRRVEVHTSRRLPIAADGDVVTQTPATFEVLPDALEVLVPSEEDAKALGRGKDSTPAP